MYSILCPLHLVLYRSQTRPAVPAFSTPLSIFFRLEGARRAVSRAREGRLAHSIEEYKARRQFRLYRCSHPAILTPLDQKRDVLNLVTPPASLSDRLSQGTNLLKSWDRAIARLCFVGAQAVVFLREQDPCPNSCSHTMDRIFVPLLKPCHRGVQCWVDFPPF